MTGDDVVGPRAGLGVLESRGRRSEVLLPEASAVQGSAGREPRSARKHGKEIPLASEGDPVAGLIGGPGAPPAEGSGRGDGRRTVYVIGVDAMTLDIIQPMVDSGELPTFAAMMAEGAHGLIETTSPSQSGLIWTTIASGVSYRAHGIDGERFFRVCGRRKSSTGTQKSGSTSSTR